MFPDVRSKSLGDQASNKYKQLTGRRCSWIMFLQLDLQRATTDFHSKTSWIDPGDVNLCKYFRLNSTWLVEVRHTHLLSCIELSQYQKVGSWYQDRWNSDPVLAAVDLLLHLPLLPLHMLLSIYGSTHDDTREKQVPSRLQKPSTWCRLSRHPKSPKPSWQCSSFRE